MPPILGPKKIHCSSRRDTDRPFHYGKEEKATPTLIIIMMLAKTLLFSLLLATLCAAESTYVSPKVDPESFIGCSTQRVTVFDDMFDIFGFGHNSTVSRALLDCVWFDTTVVTPMLKAEVPGGIDDIMQYCDADEDNMLSYDEVLGMDTCIGNCGTAISVTFFNQQALVNQSWKDICL